MRLWFILGWQLGWKLPNWHPTEKIYQVLTAPFFAQAIEWDAT